MIATRISHRSLHATSLEHGSCRSHFQLAAAYDAKLVRQFNAGDEAAFVEIIARFRERIFTTACSLVHNRFDAEDITQETFIRAYRGLARFRGDASLATWLYRIATNLSRNLYWHLVRRGRHITLSLDCPLAEASHETSADVLAADTPTPSHLVAFGEFAALVAVCMDKLDARHREILALRTSLDQSYSEIATALGIEVGTVKSRLARARGCLRRLIIESCPEFPSRAPLADWFEPRHPVGRFKDTSN